MSITMTTPGAAGWIQYTGPDTDAAKAFYRDVMGWNIADMPMQDGSSYPGIVVEDTPIGGFSPEPAEQGTWTIFITVPDVDASIGRARESGAEIVSEPADYPGVGRIATLLDPQGARIALVTYESMQ
ncbi:VOC family protein [Pseudomaricurvus alkylphenolicus]|jgi:predicted enzyme related to lactoylglutathione lyase|uniref:VOC family protein n=1 Tax=Pseudomaricurvus alkylphenolicus TaxID=1306991 RepID=UPI0014246AD0|nr:VOC family protein [Pseudomaricurvus alkylphenolicus]NIB41754.1 VOC family protein [Pseudomaricurvus alkylphenolicus]